MRVIRDDFGDVVIHLNTFLRPNHAEEYPRPDQHNGDTNKCEDVVHTRPRTGGGHHFFRMLIRCCMGISRQLDAKNTTYQWYVRSSNPPTAFPTGRWQLVADHL